MQTILIYDQCDCSIQFAVLEGDYSHLSGTYINRCEDDTSKQDELSAIIYDEHGAEKISFSTEFPAQAAKDGAIVIVVGFMP